jgi:putative RNA 2'-phosphotransferase
MIAPPKEVQRLAKFLVYVLGKRPSEFGLVPDREGYIKIKDLLKALSEEAGYRHVRRSHLDEIVLSHPDPPIEIGGELIRAKSREDRAAEEAGSLPKLLFACVRRRTHAAILEKGIFPVGSPRVLLFSDRGMAERVGRRIDPEPVTLTVLVQKSREAGVIFEPAGEGVYVCDTVPPGCFTGPTLPKEKLETRKPKAPERPSAPPMPGSFFLDLSETAEKKKRTERERKRKEISWKKEIKKLKKKKEKGWPF